MRSYQLRHIVWLLVALFVMLVVACSAGERSVEGIIIKVDVASLTQVETFTMRDNDNNIIITFRIAPDATQDPEEGFFPSHLREHAVAVGQVKVFYRVEGGEFLALKIEHE